MAEQQSIVLPVEVDGAGKCIIATTKKPLCPQSFNQSISLGTRGYKFVSIDGVHLMAKLERNPDGVKLFSADKIADGRVKSIRINYIPVKVSDDLVVKELKLMSIEARGDESSAWKDEPVNQDVFNAAKREIMESLRSDVSFVYFIATKNNPAVKIGVSRSPQERLAQLSTGAFDELEIVGMISGTPRLEKALHSALASRNVNGEWFTFDSTIRKLVDELPELERSRDGSHHSKQSRSSQDHSKIENMIALVRSNVN